MWDTVNAEAVFNNTGLHSLRPPAADFLTAASWRVHAFVGCVSALCGNIFRIHIDSRMLYADMANMLGIAMETS